MNWLICLLLFVIGFAGSFSYGMGLWSLPSRKPKKERLLSPWEIAAIEIECGIEPSWTPPPVASLVTRTDASALNFKTFTAPLMTYDPAKDGPIIRTESIADRLANLNRIVYLPPGMDITHLPPTARKGERR